MVASSVTVTGPIDGVSWPNGIDQPAVTLKWTGGTGPFSVDVVWDDDATFANGNGNQVTASESSPVTSPLTVDCPSVLGDVSDGTTWYVRATVWDEGDSGSQNYLSNSIDFTYFDPNPQGRAHILTAGNVGVGFDPTDAPAGGWGTSFGGTVGPDGTNNPLSRSHISVAANVGVGFDPTDEPLGGWGVSFGGTVGPDGVTNPQTRAHILLAANIDATQPCPFIFSMSRVLVETGDSIIIRGQGLVSASAPTADAFDAEVRVYETPSHAASFTTLTVTDWESGDLEDSITVTVPGGTVSGFVSVVHTTGATCSGSNFRALTVLALDLDRTKQWWAEVWNIRNTSPVIDHLKDATAAVIEQIPNDLGGGAITLPAEHRDIESIVNRSSSPPVQNFVKVYLWGRYAYGFFPDDVETSWSDDGRRDAVLPGAGPEQMLKWGRALWADYPSFPSKNRIWQYGATDNVAPWGTFDPDSELTNGTFDGGESDGWAPIGGASLFTTTTVSRSGSYSLRVTADTDEGVESDPFTVPEGRDSFVDIYLRDPTNSGHAVIVKVVDQDDNVEDSVAGTLSNIWEPFNLEWTPAEGEQYRIQVVLDESGITSHQWYIDDAALYSDPEIPTLDESRATVDLSRTHVSEGLHSLKVSADAGGLTTFNGFIARIPIAPSTKYRFSVLVTGTAGEDWKIAIRIGGTVVSTVHTMTGLGTFDLVTLEGTSNETDSIARLAISSQESGASVIYLDDLKILPGEPAASAGQIIEDVHTAIAARGTLSFITLNFDGTSDTSGAFWPEDLAIDIDPSWSLYDLLGYFVGLGYEYLLAPENWIEGGDTGWEISFWAPGNRPADWTLDPDGPAFLPGGGITLATPSGAPPASTVAFGEGKSGSWVEQQSSASLIAALERREDFVYNRELADSTSLARALIRRLTLSNTRGAKGSLKWQSIDADPLPYLDYLPGDILRAHLPADPDWTGIPDSSYRVAAVVVNMEEEEISGETDLGRYSLHRQSYTDQLVQRAIERAHSDDNYTPGTGRIAGSEPTTITADPNVGAVPAPHTHDDEEIFGLVEAVTEGIVSASIDDLSDVSVPVPGNNHVLTYVSANSRWESKAGGGGTSGAEVRKTSNQSISDATWTAISWNAEEYDDDSYWDGANPTRITFGTAGRYLVTVNPIFATSSTGDRYARIIRNGNTALELALVSSPAVGADTRLSLALIVNAAASDYIEAEVFQNSTGALNLVGASGTDAETTRLMVTAV